MRIAPGNFRLFRLLRLLRTRLLFAFLLALATTPLMGDAIDGFTEPYQTIDVAASEMGTLKAIDVEEGDVVTAGQVVANLDEQVLHASLQIATAASESEGRLRSVLAEVKMQRNRLTKLEGLRQRNHASQVEVDRTKNQLEVAEAQVQSVREELRIKAIECLRIEAQLEQRRLRAPIDGIVTNVYKDVGEFVASSDPVVLRVVQLDPLLVVFSVPRLVAGSLEKGQSVSVQFEDGDRPGQGIVEFVSPTADAQSGTVRVKIRLPNSHGSIQSGEACRLAIGDADSESPSPTSYSQTP